MQQIRQRLKAIAIGETDTWKHDADSELEITVCRLENAWELSLVRSAISAEGQPAEVYWSGQELYLTFEEIAGAIGSL